MQEVILLVLSLGVVAIGYYLITKESGTTSLYSIGVPMKNGDVHVFNGSFELEHIIHKSEVGKLIEYPIDAVVILTYDYELEEYIAIFQVGVYYYTNHEFKVTNIRWKFGIDEEDLKDDDSIETIMRDYSKRYKDFVS